MQIAQGASRSIGKIQVDVAKVGRRRRGRALLLSAAAAGIGFGGMARAATTIGVFGDNKPDFVYDPTTGDLSLSYDGLMPLNQGLPSFIGLVQIQSASGQLLYTNASSI